MFFGIPQISSDWLVTTRETSIYTLKMGFYIPSIGGSDHPFCKETSQRVWTAQMWKKNKHWKTSSEKMWSAFIFVVGISIHWMLPFGIDLASNKKYQHAVQVYVSLWWWAICSITAYVPILTSNELMALTVSKKWIQKTLPNWQWHPISITPCDAKFGWKGFCRFARSYAACLLKCQWHPTNCGLLEP